MFAVLSAESNKLSFLAKTFIYIFCVYYSSIFTINPIKTIRLLTNSFCFCGLFRCINENYLSIKLSLIGIAKMH